MTADKAKVESDEAQMPNESFAYFSIEPGTSVMDANEKAANDEARFPLSPSPTGASSPAG